MSAPMLHEEVSFLKRVVIKQAREALTRCHLAELVLLIYATLSTALLVLGAFFPELIYPVAGS